MIESHLWLPHLRCYVRIEHRRATVAASGSLLPEVPDARDQAPRLWRAVIQILSLSWDGQVRDGCSTAKLPGWPSTRVRRVIGRDGIRAALPQAAGNSGPNVPAAA